MAVALQKHRRGWDTMPSNVKKPYAMTIISHLIEMAAMLGLYRKVFDRAEDKYRAEGNGCMLTGTAVPDLGLDFNFQVTRNRKFKETRLIPTGDVRNLCFGAVPTIYRNLKNTERAGYPTDEPLDPSVLQVGRRTVWIYNFFSRLIYPILPRTFSGKFGILPALSSIHMVSGSSTTTGSPILWGRCTCSRHCMKP